MKRFIVVTALAAAMVFPAVGAEVQLTPDDDIQKALDAATPGDTIVLDDGVYYQNVVITRGGSEGKPITLRATKGGAATLSGAVPPGQEKLKFELVEGDLYRAAVPDRVWWAMAGARNLINYGKLEHLKKFQFPRPDKPQPSPCPPEGFAWQNRFLYVRLEGGADPNTAAIEIHRPGGHSTADPSLSKESHYAPDTGFEVPGTGHLFSKTLANVIVKADHVVIEGLRLHMGVGASVVVHGNEVTIRDCYMSGAHLAVLQPDSVRVPARGEPPIAGSNRTSRGLTVEHCEFSSYPCYEWIKRNEKFWAGLYSSNIAAVFMNYGGPRSIVRHNWLYEYFDGLQPRGNGTSSPADASEIAYNLIQNCGDDSIEFDSVTAMNLRVHHNVFLDGHCLLAISPVMGGGLTIDHNILYISPENGLTWCGLFKGGSPWGSGLPTQGVRIIHNTMVNTKGQNIGLWWVGGHRYENNVIENNIFYVARSQNFSAPGLVFGRHNLYCGLKVDPGHIPEMVHHEGSPFVSMKPMDFTLRPDGPAVDAGVAGKDYHHEPRGKAPDLGAIELGETFEYARPGPRWAQGSEIINRPTPPRVKLDLWKPSISRLDHGVRVDGVLDEWAKPSVTLRGPDNVGKPSPGHHCGSWKGPDDMTTKVHWGWDQQALYLAAEVTDDGHFNTQTGDMIWNGDALQMMVGQSNLALALTDAGIAFHRFSGPDEALRDKAEFKVVRKEQTKTTVYELRLPLVSLGVEPGMDFAFNIVFLDDDNGKGHRYWLQLAPGLCGRGAASPRYVLAK
jgi:hypothetical protein